MPVRLGVKSLTGKTYNVEVDSLETATALTVAESIQDSDGIPVGQQRIIYAGKQLELTGFPCGAEADDTTVAELGFADGKVVVESAGTSLLSIGVVVHAHLLGPGVEDGPKPAGDVYMALGVEEPCLTIGAMRKHISGALGVPVKDVAVLGRNIHGYLSDTGDEPLADSEPSFPSSTFLDLTTCQASVLVWDVDMAYTGADRAGFVANWTGRADTSGAVPAEVSRSTRFARDMGGFHVVEVPPTTTVRQFKTLYRWAMGHGGRSVLPADDLWMHRKGDNMTYRSPLDDLARAAGRDPLDGLVAAGAGAGIGAGGAVRPTVVVKSGQTIADIASAAGVEPAALMEANDATLRDTFFVSNATAIATDKAATEERPQWGCTACTFLNDNLSRCEMCETPRVAVDVEALWAGLALVLPERPAEPETAPEDEPPSDAGAAGAGAGDGEAAAVDADADAAPALGDAYLSPYPARTGLPSLAHYGVVPDAVMHMVLNLRGS